MKRFNLMMTAVLGMALATACTVDDEPCNEAGVCPDAGMGGEGGGMGGGVGGEGGGDPVEYNTLRIFDLDSPNDMVGTSGVDLCGVSVDCGRMALSASPTIGEGEVCTAEGPGCSTNRADPNAILDDGSECEVDSNPSHFISLGTSGSIDVVFDGDLSGCEITVVEFVGATEEGWEAFVCDATGENCVGGGEALHTAAAGGTESFTVPAAE